MMAMGLFIFVVVVFVVFVMIAVCNLHNINHVCAKLGDKITAFFRDMQEKSEKIPFKVE